MCAFNRSVNKVLQRIALAYGSQAQLTQTKPTRLALLPDRNGFQDFKIFLVFQNTHPKYQRELFLFD